jgi:hypothetical protein
MSVGIITGTHGRSSCGNQQQFSGAFECFYASVEEVSLQLPVSFTKYFILRLIEYTSAAMFKCLH